MLFVRSVQEWKTRVNTNVTCFIFTGDAFTVVAQLNCLCIVQAERATFLKQCKNTSSKYDKSDMKG